MHIIKVKKMGYERGNNNAGNWSGRGPYSNLPPWQRPGWVYGRGACHYLYGAPYYMQTTTPQDEATLLSQQKTVVEAQIKAMHETHEKIQARLKEINK